MKKFTTFILLILLSQVIYSQEKNILDYDPCSETINKKSLKKFEKANSAYLKGELKEASEILRKLMIDEPEFASPYYIVGLIGAQKSNPATIEKNFSKVIEICPEYSNPILFYYLGLIDYTYERFDSCLKNFNTFKKLAQDDPNITDSLIFEAENYIEWSEFITETKSNPVDFKPSKINNICTSEDEYLPFISLDKEKIFFTRRQYVKTNSESTFYEKANVEMKEIFSLATLQTNGMYDKGFPLPEPFNDSYNEGGATLTADNRDLYYTVCQPKEDYLNCDIYHSQWLGEYWSDIKNLGNNVNNLGTWESQPCISPDGKTLYFVSNRAGGYGGLDIWYSKKQKDLSWSKPINAGAKINTPLNEKAPFVHPDGVSFYFCSTGWRGLGGYDLFYLRLDDNKMKRPVNLGYPINTEGDEIGVYVTLGNEMAYFASNNIEGNSNWDIYEFELDNKYKPLNAKMLKGNVSDISNDGVGAELELTRISDKIQSNYDIDPLTGNFALVVLEDESYILKAKKEGFAFESKLITKETIEKEKPIELEIKELKVGESYVIKDILFATNSFEIAQESQQIINAFIEYLNEYPKIRCTIEGHTDNIGSEADNLVLSENRAKAVADYIIKSRIREDRIKYKGYGTKKPVADNSSEEGRAKNRRTVFKIDSM
ncbi:MAG: OmpA family protein [Bacteroidales bacterium]|nr:OmpA family protein [Bacteroidales bacterium]